MRNYLTRLFVAAIMAASLFDAQAADYPSRPIHIVSAYPAGGGVDLVGRLVASELAKRLGQSVVVENKPGAAGVVGMKAVINSQADGYTLLVTSNPSVTIAPLLSEENAESLKRLVPIVKVAVAPTIIAVNAESPYASSLKAFLDAARNPSRTITVGVPGRASTSDVEMQMLGKLAKAHIISVPYRGASFIVTDLLGKQISASAMAAPTIISHVRSGTLKVLAVISSSRTSIFPHAPTVQEAAGIRFSGFPSWYGLFAPAGTPAKVVERLEQTIISIMKTPDVIARLRKLGCDPLTIGSHAFAEENDEERRAFRQALEATNIQLK
jgi:tripartite-type tricarboxylate transporter receptor subunit TctC